MRIAMIAAMARNGVIGRDNALPWHLPEDLKYFKRTTLGKPIIMGRKTWQSIGRPLPGRTNIVLSSQPGFSAEGAVVVSSVEEALAQARAVALKDGADELVVIGGEGIYRAMFDRAERLYLTEVHADVDGDACFPPFDRSRWLECERQSYAADGANPYDYSFVVFDRQP